MARETILKSSLNAAEALNAVFAAIVGPEQLTWRARPLKAAT